MNPADWYPDPFGRYEYRFHNGTTWTADVSTNGRRYVDPFGAAPSVGPQAPPRRTKRDGLATAAMVLGIIGLSISWIPIVFVAGAVCALLAVIFGAVALRRRKVENRPFAITGLLTGGAGLLMVAVGVWTTSILIDEVDEFTNPPRATVDIVDCRVENGALVVEGTIENLGDRASEYRILIDVGGLGLRDRRVVLAVDDVHPGVTYRIDTPIRTVGLLDGDDSPVCEIADITGPLPFGLDVDPVG